MSRTLNDVKRALQRKFGPLPVWAWALILGAGIYVWRARRGDYSPQATSVPDAQSPDAMDSTGSGQLDPVTLEPGESAYNPNTGQLVSAPDGGAGGVGSDATGIASPATDDGSDTVPIWSLPPESTGSAVKPPQGHSKRTLVERVRRGKRHAKSKPHHKMTKSVKQPGNHKGKPRTVGKILKTRGSKGTGLDLRRATKPKARVRGRAATNPSGAPRARANATRSPALWQRPAAPVVTHPDTQRTTPHPHRRKHR